MSRFCDPDKPQQTNFDNSLDHYTAPLYIRTLAIVHLNPECQNTSGIKQLTMAAFLQQQHLRFLFLFLLVSVVSFASGAGAQTPVGDSCSKTATGVPRWCSEKFLKSLSTDYESPVDDHCCLLLGCVREESCADVLQAMCMHLPRHCLFKPPL
ncbi:hypothetical protein BRADI_2g61285v3 [Brachypodium distachyon]|uniref:Prolamin-like domain-containing protein n=1 Tax=Brachypodium distachyon TaxID=15368 RepID=A0A2K2DH89_BRADI|nr:hypothetical protein BRADI_2g61285v3 [Brachypodium distachyon]